MSDRQEIEDPKTFEIRNWHLAGGLLAAMLALASMVAIQFLSTVPVEHAAGPILTFQVILIEFVLLLLGIAYCSPSAGTYRSPVTLLAIVVLLAATAHRVFPLHEQASLHEDIEDLAGGALFLFGGVLLWGQVRCRSDNPMAIGASQAGLILLIGLAFLDVTDDLLFTDEEDGDLLVDTLDEAALALVLLLYAFGLFTSLLAPVRALDVEPDDPGRRIAKSLREFGYSLAGAKLSILSTEARYRLWRLGNRDGSFSDFYAWRVARKLDDGRAHRTLGTRRFDRDSVIGHVPAHDTESFARAAPHRIIADLLGLGLMPQHTLVDYGCGSLRVGQHLISYLDADRYWGLDVTDRFFQDGLAMIAEDTRTTKRPRCRVTSPTSLREAGMAEPDFVMSVAVLKHVPPRELDAYFDAIFSLIGQRTTLVLTFSESSTEKRLCGKSWSYSSAHVAGLISARRPDFQAEIVRAEPLPNRNGVALTYCVLVARRTRPQDAAGHVEPARSGENRKAETPVSAVMPRV
ncbi:MAG: hypothetical protein ACR2PM_16820 [Hyphomicrobiales bacterium]